MAKNENRKLSPAIIADDETAYLALQKITAYAPVNPNYSLAALTQAFTEMHDAQVAVGQIEGALALAEDEAIKREWVVHNLMLNVKDQVKAQFGKDSAQVHEIGLKRKSEYKTRKPRSTPSVKSVTQ